MSTIGALLRRPDDGSRPEFIVVNARVRHVRDHRARVRRARWWMCSPRGDFEFPLDGVRAAITPRTRLVFITSPNNPTGVRVSNDAIRSVARAVPAGAIVFVDEAYHDFCGDTALPLVDSCPNVVVGRTFAKAHGLAALRVGALMGVPDTMDPLQRGDSALQPERRCRRRRCGRQWPTASAWPGTWTRCSSRGELVYEFCTKHGFTFWVSGANFVLARVGDRSAGSLVSRLAAAGIYIRDKSADPGCAGCIRVTTGIVEHTRRSASTPWRRCCATRGDRSQDDRDADSSWR